MEHQKRPHTFAFPVHSGKWDECDGCTDDVPSFLLTTFDDYRLCQACLRFHKRQKAVRHQAALKKPALP